MYIVIVGGGSVGYYLSKALLGEGHEVLIVEKDAHKCGRIEDDLGSVCLRGDGCEAAVQVEAGVSRADIFIATTSQDEDNLVACQVAKHKFEVPRTTSLVNNPRNVKIFKKLGIDSTISVTSLIMEHIEQEIPAHQLIHLLAMIGKMDEIVEINVRKNAPAVGNPIGQLILPEESTLALIISEGDRPRIPTPQTVLKENDRIIAVTTVDREDELEKEINGP